MKNRKSYFKFIVLFFILLSVANVSGSNNDITNVTAAKVCSHPYYIRYGEGKYVKVSYSNDSTYCYKTSFKYKQKCGICAQKISQPSYDAWKKHKHDYGFFNLKKIVRNVDIKNSYFSYMVAQRKKFVYYIPMIENNPAPVRISYWCWMISYC